MSIVRSLMHQVGGLLRLSTKPFRTGPHITRYAMYQRLKELGGLHDLEMRMSQSQGGCDALAVSHSANLLEILGVRSSKITKANYPDVNILQLPFADESFDIVVADQVLEHVEGDPRKAMEETRRVLRPGGIALHTTCFLMPRHGAPSDYWRFTPDALRLLCSGFSEVLAAEGWGNQFVLPFSSLGLQRLGIPHASWHPVHQIASWNHPDWPVTTWVLAVK